MTMMKLTLSAILNEASAKEIAANLKKKYPSRLTDVDVVVGSGNPPATWPLIMRMVDGSGERVEEILGLVRSFNRLKPKLAKKDLGQYENAQELRQALEDVAGTKTKTAAREDIKGQVEKIYEDENFVVVYPHSKEASCVWGAGTTWCTAATQSANYFPYYSGAGNKLYYLITKGVDPKVDPSAKLSMGFDPDGQFSGGEDGGLSVNAKNEGITLTDVLNYLRTKTDPATARSIVQTVETHATSSGDHPMKGFYEKMLTDPAAHRSIFDDAMKSNSPEPYIAALTFADMDKIRGGTYRDFTFDMCVYLNQLLKTFGLEHEAIQDFMDQDSVYRRGPLYFSSQTDPAALDQYIKDAMWLFETDKTFLTRPLAYNMNSVPNAIKAIQTERLPTQILRAMLMSQFLDKEAVLETIRAMAIDPTLTAEQRTPFIYALELTVSESGNFEAWTEAVLFHNEAQKPTARYSAWMYMLSSPEVHAQPKLLAHVARDFIIPNIAEIMSHWNWSSNIGVPGMLERLSEYLSHGTPDGPELFHALSDLYFIIKDAGTTETKRMYTAWEWMVSFGIKSIASVNFERLMQLVDDSLTDRRPDYRIGDIIQYVKETTVQDPKLIVIMRRVAEMARKTYVPSEGSVPAYAIWWWRSPSIPPEYIPARDELARETNNFGIPSPKLWPPPGPASAATLSELLFR